MGTKVGYSKDSLGQLRAVRVDRVTAPRVFPDWDILKELDRRVVRKKLDRRRVTTRVWMREHPEEVERIVLENKDKLECEGEDDG